VDAARAASGLKLAQGAARGRIASQLSVKAIDTAAANGANRAKTQTELSEETMKPALIGAGLAALIASTAPAAGAQQINPNSGVRFAETAADVEGPTTIAGTKAFESPVPFFKDLKPWDPNYRAPRTLDGKPDLQGVWSTASLTTLTRGSGRNANVGVDTLVIPPEKVAEATNRAGYTRAFADSQKRTDPNSGVFTDKNVDAGYNAFWIDPGSEWAKVNGEWRSSWIVSPANGQIPYTAEGRKALGARMSAVRNIRNTGPEIRTIGDRCLLSFANQGGPPITNAMYNNHVEVVQTPTHVMLNIEMNHDARIIPLRDSGATVGRPAAVKPWFGDSVGWWEGETLVVETRNLHPIQANGRIPLSETGKVIERFRRVSDVELFYSFEVHDPVNYTEVWKGEMPMRKSNEKVYEYACHEGNYALPGILRGDSLGLDTAIDQDGE
jgi:hypothetical protein